MVRGQVLLGRLRREMGELEAARKLLSTACRQDPDFIFAWLERIRVETQAGSWTAAGLLLTEAEGRFGVLQPQLLREALLIKTKTRQLPAALEAARELVRICPQWREIRDLRDQLEHLLNSAGKA